MKIVLCIPTRNAASIARPLIEAISAQSLTKFDRLIIDSFSNDGTGSVFAAAGFRIYSLSHTAFDHGATRKLATELYPDADIIIFMTQDAVPASACSLQKLIEAFSDPQVGASFGRQLPTVDSTPIAAHVRLFNYPPESRIKEFSDVPVLGLKTAFISNSFAAYRRSALEALGGFPGRCIVSEDTYVAAKMLLAGWKIAYCAEARVYHSHDYNYLQDFQRYFDIGVFHAREPWIRKTFGGAEGEGWRFLRSELNYLSGANPWLIPSALLRTLIKYLGFRAGLFENSIPSMLKRRMSMQKAFWDHEICGIFDA